MRHARALTLAGHRRPVDSRLRHEAEYRPDGLLHHQHQSAAMAATSAAWPAPTRIARSWPRRQAPGNRTWRAYLSTSYITARQPRRPVNARDRIGKGPWYNAKGELIARDVTHLHNGNNLNKQTALTEKGTVVKGRGDTPNQHDILTGSRADGTAYRVSGQPNLTCGNGRAAPRLGHRRPPRPAPARCRTPGQIPGTPRT